MEVHAAEHITVDVKHSGLALVCMFSDSLALAMKHVAFVIAAGMRDDDDPPALAVKHVAFALLQE